MMCKPGAEATSAVENLLDILATGRMFAVVFVLDIESEKTTE